MFEFSSTKTFPSELYSDVSFTIRIMTDGVRAKLNLALAETMASMRSISGEINALDIDRDDKGVVKQVNHLLIAQAMNLTDKVVGLRRFKVDPEYFKNCFVSISGIKIDGKENPDGATLKEYGPENLYQEIVARIHEEADLTQAERENLRSPITSAAAGDGQTNDLTVAPANKTDITKPETALVTSQKT